ncbi:hypothetical protein CWO90_01065 [Bradyrhizobium sp. Leo121]|nr:hypothetical protein CWO90_01065 [Bradyrhizobium sp. Leo121]
MLFVRTLTADAMLVPIDHNGLATKLSEAGGCFVLAVVGVALFYNGKDSATSSDPNRGTARGH